MTVSQKDIAQKLEISQALVSKVINGKTANVWVGKETRQRILQVASELGYRPNRLARSLRTKRSTTIGLLTHDSTGGNIPKVTEEATKRGYEVVSAFSLWGTSEETVEIHRLLDRQIDGLLLENPAVDQQRHKVIEGLVQKRFPIVCIGPQPCAGCDYVDSNRRLAYRELGHHLLQQGCDRLMFMGSRVTPGVQQRLDGLQDAIDEIGKGSIAVRTDMDGKDPSRVESDLPAILEVNAKDGWPDALICHTSHMALVAIRAAQKLGKRVPQDLAIVGGSEQEYCKFISPSITTFESSTIQKIEIAMQRLFERIHSPKSAVDPFETILPQTLIPRESSMYGQTR